MDIKVIEKAICEVIESASEFYKNFQEKVNTIPKSIQEILFLSNLSMPLTKILESQEEFTDNKTYMIWLGNSGKGLMPHTVAPLLLKKSVELSSPTKAIEWFVRILNTKEAKAKIYQTILYIKIEKTIDFDSELSLIPFSEIPSSQNKDAILESANSWNPFTFPSPLNKVPPSTLVAKIVVKPLVTIQNPTIHHQPKPLPQYNKLELARIALTCIGPSSPIVTTSWVQFDDPELQDVFSFLGAGASYNLDSPLFIQHECKIDPLEAREAVNNILKLSGTIAERITIALQRLNRAMWHLDSRDKALDLAIALEALFTEGAGENSFKVGLRTGILFPGDLKDKLHTRSIINALYIIRNSVVHSGIAPRNLKTKKLGKILTSDVIDESAKIVSKIIQIIAKRGSIPNWDEIELK